MDAGIPTYIFGMGVDRTVVRAYGWMVAIAVLLSAGSAVTLAWAVGEAEIALLFLPLVAAYATIMIAVWLVLATYGAFRSRLERQI